MAYNENMVLVTLKTKQKAQNFSHSWLLKFRNDRKIRRKQQFIATETGFMETKSSYMSLFLVVTLGMISASNSDFGSAFF